MRTTLLILVPFWFTVGFAALAIGIATAAAIPTTAGVAGLVLTYAAGRDLIRG